MRGDEIILKPIQCGNIKLPTYSPAHFQPDPNSPLVRIGSNLHTTAKYLVSSTTKEPDFDKPPNFK